MPRVPLKTSPMVIGCCSVLTIGFGGSRGLFGERTPRIRKRLVHVQQTRRNARKELADERELIRLFADTLEQVRDKYVESNVSDRELIEAAIHGMISRARSLFGLHCPAGSRSVPQRGGTRICRHWHSGFRTRRTSADH